MTALLEAKNVSVRFGGLQALSDVSFTIDEAEIVGLIGPNGAGKSTLFGVCSGLVRANSGEVLVSGRRADRRAPHAVARMGVGRTFQTCRLFTSLTVLENVVAVLSSAGRSSIGLLQPWHSSKPLSEARELLDDVGLLANESDLASELPYGLQRRLEIARALALHPKVLLLDEPCAGLTHTEANEIVEYVRRLRERGIAVVIIEHNMAVIMGAADRVIVLDHGAVIASGSPATVSTDSRVIEAYLGVS
jgi:branched-chain amino acid transport system ATP-binding protein